jgi:hypothetical protein
VNDGVVIKIAAIGLLVGLSGCVNLSEAKQWHQQAPIMKAKCDAGSASACVEYQNLLAACTHGTALNGGLNMGEVNTCANAVRQSKQASQ